MTDSELVALQRCLAASGVESTKSWWEAYLKGAIEFRGVRMADTRRCVHAWFEDHRLAEGDRNHRVDLAGALVRETMAEDKLAGVILLGELLLPSGDLSCGQILAEFAAYFDEGHIADWNTCDWFCVKVLGVMIADEGEHCARAIATWSTAENLWRRRAAGVAFVNLAPAGDANFAGFIELVLGVCADNVQHPERFSQTGVGWVLRELSHADPEAVRSFVAAHLGRMSREAVRSATGRLAETERLELLELHKRA